MKNRIVTISREFGSGTIANVFSNRAYDPNEHWSMINCLQ